ncbi:MAG TPA: hypothetical protein VIZ65_08675 [Cellvibrionaceae bacterium]
MLKRAAIIGLGIIGFSEAIHAGGSNGNVATVMVHSGNAVIFDAGVHNQKPACSIVGNHWAFSLTSEDGKAMYAMLLTAAAQNKKVSVYGTGLCSAWPDRETPLYISIDYQ